MGAADIEHALIVTGPSGAGKSTFLREVAAWRLPERITQLLPAGSNAWPVICGAHPQQWLPFQRESGVAPGVAMHYDITTAWKSYRDNFAADPFWQLLNGCKGATWIDIRPARRRLIRQWTQEHRDTASLTRAQLMALRAHCSALLRRSIRRLRRQVGSTAEPSWRYPKPLRFLKQVDIDLRARATLSNQDLLDFYCKRGNLEMLLAAWDRTAPEFLGSYARQRVDLAPDPSGRIGLDPHWCVVGLSELPPR